MMLAAMSAAKKGRLTHREDVATSALEQHARIGHVRGAARFQVRAGDVHGDSHIFRVDKPLYGSTSGRAIENLTRVETVGHPDARWVRATVDPKNPSVFTFRVEVVPENLLDHGARSP
jgi:hypothetical protein